MSGGAGLIYPGDEPHALEQAVRHIAGPDAALLEARPLAADRGGTELKQAGYGEPLLLRYRGPDGER